MGLLWRCVRPVLFALESEKAHGLALTALKMGWGRRDIFGQCPTQEERLRVRLGKLEFANPLGMAAGFDKNGEVGTPLARLGFGHVEVGTVTPKPQSGNARPRLFRLGQDRALINRMGFNNHGHQALYRRLVLRKRLGILGLNIGANKYCVDRIADYTEAIELFHPHVDYFTVNISSPNTPGLRDLQARDALDELLTRLHIVRKKIQEKGGKDRPIFLKIAPDLSETELDDIAQAVLSHFGKGCEGLVISNTTLSRRNLSSHHATQMGGLSGRPLFEPSTILLAKMRQRVGKDMPIIGVGGIGDGATALEKIRAGADLIQIYSCLIFEGPGQITKILRQLVEFCVRDGVAHISQYRDTHVEQWASRRLSG